MSRVSEILDKNIVLKPEDLSGALTLIERAEQVYAESGMIGMFSFNTDNLKGMEFLIKRLKDFTAQNQHEWKRR